MRSLIQALINGSFLSYVPKYVAHSGFACLTPVSLTTKTVEKSKTRREFIRMIPHLWITGAVSIIEPPPPRFTDIILTKLY